MQKLNFHKLKEINNLKDTITVSLSDLIDIKHGYAFKGQYFTDNPTQYILLTPGNFSIGGGFKDDKFVYYEGPIDKDFTLDEGDLIVTMTDLSKIGDTLGYPAIVPLNTNFKFLHNQRLGKIIIKNSNLDKWFLYYLLCSNEYRQEILASATGTTVRHTSPNRILSFKFCLPKLKEQQKIASILLSIDELIQKTEQIIEQTQRLKKGLINKLVTDGLDVRGLSRKKITENYRYEQLNQVAIINPKYKLQNDREYLFVEMAALNEKTKSIEYFSNRKQASGYSIFKNDDTIFARITPCTENGKTCLVSNLDNYGLGSTEFIVLSPNDRNELLPDFLCYYCQTDKVRNYAISQMRGATGRQRVPDKVFKNDLFIILPDIETQKKIVSTIKSVETFVNKVQIEKKKTENLKKGLMQQLLTGKIRVKV